MPFRLSEQLGGAGALFRGRQQRSLLIPRFGIVIYARKAHRNTLAAIFTDPIRANVPWSDVEALFIAAGGSISQGWGSRVRVSINGVDAMFHRPHPQRETDKGALRSVRRFLREAGIVP
jgi:hypothetical protein